MGILGKIFGSDSGYFVFRGDGGRRISPEQYGHWLHRWSIESGFKLLSDIKNGDCGSSPIADELGRNGQLHYIVGIQLTAVFAAAYWFYAGDILRVGQDIEVRMKVGLDDGILSTRMDGKPLEAYGVQLLRSSLLRYYGAIVDDSSKGFDAAGEYAYKANGGAVATAFFEILDRYFPDMGRTATDIVLIGNIVSNIPANLCATLSNEMRMDFVH